MRSERRRHRFVTLVAGMVAATPFTFARAVPALPAGSPDPPAPASAAPSAAAPPGPVLALEDSLRTYALQETTLVEAPRIPLLEIIRRAQEGERHKFDGITTMALNRTVRVTERYGGREPQAKCEEQVSRVYFRSPDRWAETELRDTRYLVDAAGERKPWEDEDEDGVKVSMSDERQVRRLSDLPFYLERLDRYRFEIVNRSFNHGEMLYEIRFEPRSDFEPLMGGRIWLLTNGYRIVREEFEVRQVPYPWAIRSLSLITREWQEIDGHWVEKRITARVGLREGIGLGLIKVPEVVEIVLLFDQYRFDLPLDPALFGEEKP